MYFIAPLLVLGSCLENRCCYKLDQGFHTPGLCAAECLGARSKCRLPRSASNLLRIDSCKRGSSLISTAQVIPMGINLLQAIFVIPSAYTMPGTQLLLSKYLLNE